MFATAIASLVVALIAAIFSYSGVPDATAAATAQHVHFVAMGLFVISAVATILELEPSRGVRALLAGDETHD
jgi:uncharacterized membrane protein YtjA (UPF0391 family)